MHPNKDVPPKVIVKFEPGEAVAGKFAENILSGAGLPTTRSLAYTMRSKKGKNVTRKVQELLSDKSNWPDPADQGKFNRMKEVVGTIDKGQAVIVSDFVPALGTLGEILTPEWGKKEEWAKNLPEKQLGEAFNDIENAVMLGKLLVLDAFLGNQDRLEEMNLANVMLAMRGGKWRFVLIDNDADVPNMLGELKVHLNLAAESSGLGKTHREKATVTVKSWVNALIAGGRSLERNSKARINFIQDAVKSASLMVTDLKEKFFLGGDKKTPIKGLEGIFNIIKWGQLQRGVLHGIHQGTNSILNISLKELKKMFDQEKKSLGKSEFLSLYGLELKWHYVRLVMEQKKTHDDAMAELEQMASKKMKDLTGSSEMVYSEKTGRYEVGKIKK